MKLMKLLTGAALAVGLATTAIAQDKTKVGFVFVGPIGDGGWTYEHNKGRLAVEEALGDAVETVYVENVAEGPDAERVMTQMALDGADLIFTTSFGYMDPTINVAAKFPNVKFEHATGYKRADNVSTYSARFYEGRAIQGHIAGKMTKSNIVGYIGSYPIPEVIRGPAHTHDGPPAAGAPGPALVHASENCKILSIATQYNWASARLRH